VKIFLSENIWKHKRLSCLGIKFIINILNNIVLSYNCSDKITNEILHIENNKTKLILANFFIMILINII